jgi:hypothetical protein
MHKIQNVRSVPIALLTILKTPRRAATVKIIVQGFELLEDFGSCQDLHAVQPVTSANVFTKGDVLDNPY